MKRNLTTLVIALLLGLGAYWLYTKNGRGTIDSDVKEFAIPDPANIEKIILSNHNNKIELVRKDGATWELNSKHTANTNKVKALLYVIQHVDVKQPVKKANQEKTINTIVTTGVLCEIYNKENNLMKAYYVADSIQGGTGMVLVDLSENKPVEMAFVTYVAGVDENLATNYFTDEKLWRDNTVFSYSDGQIKSVKLQVPLMPQADYELTRDNQGNYRIKMLATSNELPNLDTLSVKQYLSYFSQLNFERFETDLSEAERDKLLKSTPLNILTLTDMLGKTNTVRFYPLKNFRNIKDKDGKLLEIDPDRMLALLNNQTDLVVVKYFEFGKVMPPAVYFRFK